MPKFAAGNPALPTSGTERLRRATLGTRSDQTPRFVWEANVGHGEVMNLVGFQSRGAPPEGNVSRETFLPQPILLYIRKRL